MRVPTIASTFSVLLASVTMPALAQAPAQTPPQTHAPRDPNERICELVTGIGSRIGAKKICATRAEWAQRTKADRAALEQMQMLQGRPCVDAQKGTGRAPAC
jgi:hypothetical protein